MKTSNMFLIGLGAVAAGYVALGQYRAYEKRKALARALNPANPTGVTKLLETISTKSTSTGVSTVTVPPTAGLLPCNAFAPDEAHMWPVYRFLNRCA